MDFERLQNHDGELLSGPNTSAGVRGSESAPTPEQVNPAVLPRTDLKSLSHELGNRAFWRSLRDDFRGLRTDANEHKDAIPYSGKFCLEWESALPRCLNGERVRNTWTLVRFPNETLKKQFRELATKAASAFGHDSEGGWFDEFRPTDSDKPRSDGWRIGPDGRLLWYEHGFIDDAIEESISVCGTIISEIEAASSHPQTRTLSPEASNGAAPPKSHVHSTFLAHESDGLDQEKLVPTQTSKRSDGLLNNRLKEAEARTQDPKLRKELVAVMRYDCYFAGLKSIKAACQQYQTPALLEEQFRSLDVWAALADDDKRDIAAGKFNPGRFAWALVRRQLNLTGKDDRTLKNYRKSLRAAGLL